MSMATLDYPCATTVLTSSLTLTPILTPILTPTRTPTPTPTRIPTLNHPGATGVELAEFGFQVDPFLEKHGAQAAYARELMIVNEATNLDRTSIATL